MYAVVQTGGKQYRVAPGDQIAVEKIEAEAGSTISLDQVLMVHDGTSARYGTPMVEGVSVAAEVVEQGRGPKITIFKKKRRQNYRRKKGHRQLLTMLKITDLGLEGDKPKAKTKATTKAAEEAAPAAEAASGENDGA